MIDKDKNIDKSPEKVTITLSGTVDKVISQNIPEQPEKVQISIEGAEPLYKEIRVDNTLYCTPLKLDTSIR